ncbi:S1/P1 nuclease [Paludisphaera rhizosphaerae]|uniref:S1/P1 nuclease n=1 Tax=Paludisphaera rhizosphaerae TaxID=2711216 RepID=UPI0013EBE8C2|nr:S1/P1 nuclease [Paludisphaera rhizosphaerae]
MPPQAVPTRSTAGLAPLRTPRRRRLIATAAALLAAFVGATPPSVFAWGRNAHRASARLAESRLTPEARALIRELLDEGESLADASTWADDHSRDIPGSASWHFVNVPVDSDHYEGRYCHGDCVVTRLAEFRRILADPTAPKARRRMALRYVVHLVQDVHQPLHVGDRRDRGGNNVQVSFFRDDFTNLHQVWDSGILRMEFHNERQAADALFEVARRPTSRAWLGGKAEDWADESLEAAKKAYIDPATGQTIRSGARLGDEYQTIHIRMVVERLTKAGLRLSEVLNADLADSKRKDAAKSNAVPAPHLDRSRQPQQDRDRIAPGQPPR